MKRFLAIYIGSESDEAVKKWDELDEVTREAREETGKAAWMNWAIKNHSAITDHGAPLGNTKRADVSGVSDTQNRMTAFTIVQAESHEAAAKLFINHPHFTVFPGDSVEIMECLPMPEVRKTS